MTKLNDLESILLSVAAQRESQSLFPVPDTVANAGARLATAIAALTKRGFAEERETSDKTAARRTDGDLSFGVFITEAGSTAIGVGDAIDAKPPTPGVEATPRGTKTSAVLALLQRTDGASLSELIAATGWLPHTTRAALTGIRKKGHAVERSKRGDDTCYRIVATA